MVLVGTRWYCQNRAVLVANMMSFQKIYGVHGVNHQIIEYSKKEKVITDKQTHTQTHRISSCRLDPFCKRGQVKTGAFLVLIFWGGKLVGANFYAFCNYAHDTSRSRIFSFMLRRKNTPSGQI